ncbi:MAG: hypothetical protein A4E63_01565 [Syntrophorhabdus sp. PtaU1.Bin050]|nr:MAG: hypothetical protein A4E63_01565 [Syntrophorhabdus sp. PtaU1.Bin050]
MIIGSNTAADIGVMENAGREGNQLLFVKDGAYDAHIVEMTRQGPWVIRDEDVAGPVVFLGKFANKVFHPKGHGPRLAGRCKGPLGQFPAQGVGEHAGIIMGISE